MLPPSLADGLLPSDDSCADEPCAADEVGPLFFEVFGGLLVGGSGLPSLVGGAVVPTGHEVLVVDDEAVVLTVLREALRRGGYRVTTAASAEEVIDLMHKRRFDLVLTDKNLPGASGLDVLRAARNLNPAPAIVLITGYSSFDSAVEALDIGAHD